MSDLAEIVKADLPAVTCGFLAHGDCPLFIVADKGHFTTFAIFLDWLRTNRGSLDRLVVEHGGIFLRGFPVTSAEEFNAVAGMFPIYARGYTAGGSPRDQVYGNILESTRLAGPVNIGVHSEMNYLRDYPPRIFFFCKHKADKAGETTIADLRKATPRMPESWKEKVKRLKVRTVRNYAPPSDEMNLQVSISEQMPWDKGFNTRDRDEVERICDEMGIEYHWLGSGGLAVISLVDGYVRHPATEQDIYRAAIHTPAVGYSGTEAKLKEAAKASQQYPSGFTLGDGSNGTSEECAAVTAAIDEATKWWEWENGDMMLLDNLQVMHGRRPYEGDHREVLVALLD